LGAVRIFKKQGALVDSGESSAEGSGVTPLLFFRRMAASAFIKMLDCTVPKQPVPSRRVFLSCKRNGWTSGIAVSIFDDKVDPKHRPVMASYVRSVLK